MTPETAPPPFFAESALFDRFARFYDGDYRDYDDDLGMILDLAEEQGGRVLELGVGTGRVLLPLVDAGHQVTGVDISPALLAVAHHKLNAMGYEARATLVEGDLLRVELPAGAFALAVCTSNTLMHLADGGAQQ
ncbi:MAG: class I SAM-dependent methyltransferase, partial [Caldilineaceae bacterium]